MKKRMRISFNKNLTFGILILLSVIAGISAQSFAAFVVYSDMGISGNDVWTWGTGLSTYNTNFVDPTAPEGSKSFKTYSTGWAGWGIVHSSLVNLSAYTGGKLVFWIKTDGNVTIEVEDNNSTHPVYTDSYGVYNGNGNWYLVQIPLSDFGAGLDLSNVKLPIKATMSVPGNFYIDNIRYESSDTTAPGSPLLQEPADNSTVFDQTPYFNWSDVTDPSGISYDIQADNTGNLFPSPEINLSNIVSSDYTPAVNLSAGPYWWHVRATDGAGNAGVWSSTAVFTVAAVDTSSPAVPSPVSPANGSSTYDTTPIFEWTEVTDPSGVSYRFQIDDENTFSAPLTGDITNLKQNKYSISPSLSGNKTYYWRVKAIDGAGNQSNYSTTRNILVSSSSWTAFNVLNDQGAAGYVGVYKEPGAAITFGVDYSTYTEGNRSEKAVFSVTPSNWAGWYVEEGSMGGSETRYMVTYSSGYLCFSVKTSTDVEVGIRSNNVLPDSSASKLLLGRDLGVLLNGQWQEVSIPISTFTALDSNLDLSQMVIYFNAAVVGSKIGSASGVYWIDNVRWMSPGSISPDIQKVLKGLQNKQNQTTGLVRSFETMNRAVTYDQALAIMGFCYYGDLVSAQKVLNAYKNNIGWTGVGGYADEYNMDTYGVIMGTRTVGPNLWMLQAIMYYRYISDDTTYDAMMNNLADWLSARQGADGGLVFGHDGSNWMALKGTEHNLTAYAAFKNYAQVSGNNSFNTKADNIKAWLDTNVWGYWNSEAVRRFKVGSTNPAIDKAIDCYSLAVLAFPQGTYNECFDNVDSFFKVTKTCDLTGAPVEGYDFGANTGLQPDKDSVWLEGTGQMAVAYYVKGGVAQWGHFTDEIEKAVAPMGSDGQGITYATNQGTAYYGWNMDSTHQCISSAVWYLFAKNKFNPFYPFPRFQASIYNVLDNSPANHISWSPPALPYDDWKSADQYIKIECEPNLSKWAMQIYTDNSSLNANPKYTGSTTTVNCAGLIDTVLTERRLPLCWRLTEDTTDSLTIVQGTDDSLYSAELGGQAGGFPCFLWMKDIRTPDLPGEKTEKFVYGEDYVTLWDGARGCQQAESSWVKFDGINYLYLGANFAGALTPREYKTNKLTLEFFRE